ncbi:MAG: pyridoxamine 5'-phosphate oxidase family protein [Prevotella sp.]|nr:pyridoxamine 5'-phosphate oxidase family protein [Prevotella sp.]
MNAITTVYEFLDHAKTYYLATVEDNQPRVRIYGTILLFEGELYIMALRHTNAVNQIAKNHNAEIATFDQGKQLRLTCRLEPTDRQEVRNAMAEKMPMLKTAAGEKYSNFVMMKIIQAHATIADMAGNGETYTF